MTLKWILVSILGIGLGLLGGATAWYEVNLQPADLNVSQTQTYTLASGTGVDQLASDLQDKGLIKSARAFVWYVTLNGLRAGLQAGNYELAPNQPVAEVADVLSQGRVAQNRLVLPEGITIAKIRELAADKGITAKDFDTALAESYPHDFLKVRPPGATLEGYLFPASYEVIKPPRPHVLIQAMLDNFAKQVSGTDIVRSLVAEGLTLHQGVTLASIVEKEAAKPADRPLIAQVFINRLKAGMPLASDVTIIYAAGQLGKPFDVNLDSPYNTYNHKGLPPGPICNPGLDAMKAVAHPAPNDYLYFLADKSGTIHYAKTPQEHQQNVQKYLK